ncbi:class I SAM-dependent methyltransferase [Azotobacter salinestris]|uniref:class I SAM-dependent methyltransferase n=1 Tax=Azotobacter salinestris TaxID=69964 RepID=UPI0032DEFE9C
MIEQQCPVCGDVRLFPFLHRGQVPVHQNLVVMDKVMARSVTRGDLDLVVCEGCGFIFNRAFELSLLSYGQDYDNTQSCSAYFNTYLDGLVKDLVEQHGVRDCTIVEVECGKGQFIKKLVSYPGVNNRGYGFDPSYVGPDTDLDGRVSFRHCHYDDRCVDVAADVVVCRHVIEHAPDPLVLLGSVRTALAGAFNTRVFFETPCVEWILRNRVVWDFFYEHCSLFTAESLGVAFERAGFVVERLEHIFGGQYLWLEGRPSCTTSPLSPISPHTAELAKNYGACEVGLKGKWLSRLQILCAEGKIVLWGAVPRRQISPT